MPGTPDTLGPSKKSADKDEDPYVAKVIKYIPAETIAAYQAMTGFVPEHAMSKVAPWFALFLLVMTPVWILVATKEKNERWAWYQAVVGVVAFLVWLFAIDSPAAHQVVAVDGGVPGYVRSLVLVGASMVFPVIEKILKINGIKV
jgi:uncharacterized membrane protein